VLPNSVLISDLGSDKRNPAIVPHHYKSSNYFEKFTLPLNELRAATTARKSGRGRLSRVDINDDNLFGRPKKAVEDPYSLEDTLIKDESMQQLSLMLDSTFNQPISD